MMYDTIEQATHAWVETFNRIPIGIVDKLIKAAEDEDDAIQEITPPSKYDRVYIWQGDYYGEDGNVVDKGSEPNTFLVRLDATGETVTLDREDFEIRNEDYLPMWGTMWAFSDSIDNDWLSGEFGVDGLQLMADCGFRIYKQEDYDYIFGIDGAGYDFFERHWIPLYKARGLHWHKDDGNKDSLQHN